MNNGDSINGWVMTTLEGRVEPGKWHDLEQIFETGSVHKPDQMVRTYLVQSSSDADVWRIVSIWRSRGALNEYRQSVETPGGVLMFRAVGAEPELSMFDVRSPEPVVNA